MRQEFTRTDPYSGKLKTLIQGVSFEEANRLVASGEYRFAQCTTFNGYALEKVKKDG